jgi:hypothetical protein
MVNGIRKQLQPCLGPSMIAEEENLNTYYQE